MEPIILAATAIAATIMTKAFEKTGEKLGEKVAEESGRFLKFLKRKDPETATAIELSSTQPLDYGKAVIDVSTLAKDDYDFLCILHDLAVAAQQDEDLRMSDMNQIILDTLGNKRNNLKNLPKLAEKIEKIGVLNQNSTINNQANTINL